MSAAVTGSARPKTFVFVQMSAPKGRAAPSIRRHSSRAAPTVSSKPAADGTSGHICPYRECAGQPTQRAAARYPVLPQPVEAREQPPLRNHTETCPADMVAQLMAQRASQDLMLGQQ